MQIIFQGESVNYYSLQQTADLTRPFTSVQMAFGTAGEQSFVRQFSDSVHARFFRILQRPIGTPSDTDLDGIDDVYELHHPSILDPLNAADASLDGDGDGISTLDEYLRGLDPLVSTPRLTSFASSPSNGETDVAVTRETILTLSRPLSPSTIVNSAQLFATSGNRQLLSRVEVSSERDKITLFYLENLPAAARILVTFLGDDVLDSSNTAVDADGDHFPGGTGTIEFDTLGTSPLRGTIVCGRVFASEPGSVSTTNRTVNTPLPGVIISADGVEESVRAVTDAFGNFRLTNAPSGPFFVHIDGRVVTNVATGVHYPDLSYYPYVGKQWESIPGGETNVGEIYLPLITSGTLRATSTIDSTKVTFPDEVLGKHPELQGTTLNVPPNALFSDNGTRGGKVGIAPVPADRLPGPLPAGLSFPIVITVQTDGPSNFDSPVPVCFPNLANLTTGQTLKPGEKTALWSFNHDTGRWEVVGSMTVSSDGLHVCSDPGVGILQPGWHSFSPGCSGGGGPPTCSLAAPPTPEGYELIDNNDVYKVRLFSGEFFESVVDLSIKSIGFNLEWRRDYRSRFGINSAQGNGWDFSYNIKLIDDGDGLRVCNGTAREDLYRPREEDKWVYNGYFRELSPNPDGSYTQVFDDFKKWTFNALDGSEKSGLISKMEDRFENTIEFDYDGQGRLKRVFYPELQTPDGLPIRRIDIYYNEDGFIDRIEGTEGRLVKYEYYRKDEIDGEYGDLKRVTRVARPPAIGDYLPSSDQTTDYTYSTGFSDRRRNNNLLTITSGGIKWLENEYSTNELGNDFNFDRILKQRWGNIDDTAEVTYTSTVPSPDNENACTSAMVRDRNGFISEFFYDAGNRLTKLMRYAGLNGLGRTDLLGKSVGPFITRFGYNDDNQPTFIRYPNGSEVEYTYEADLDPTASSRIRGNLRKVERSSRIETPGSAEVDPAEDVILTEKYEYAAEYGSKFFGLPIPFVTKYTDARTNSVLSTYDIAGNLVKRIHRIPSIVEEFTYNRHGQIETHTYPDNGSQWRRVDRYVYLLGGYREQEIIDSTGLALTNRFEYDHVGNAIRKIDPRGNASESVFNTANQLIREFSRPAFGTIRYRRDYSYDARGNLRQSDILNLNEQGVVAANSVFTTAFEYDALGSVSRKSEEVSEGQTGRRNIVTEFEYDHNHNLVLTRSGEATAGRQLENVVERDYVERNLLSAIIRAPGAADESTTAFDYDSNGNLSGSINGAGVADARTLQTYDAFNRLVKIEDSMGNLTFHRYDRNGNLTNTIVSGELVDDPGGARNTRLQEIRSEFDAENRIVRTDRMFFDPQTRTSIDDGAATTLTTYSDASLVIKVVDDRGNAHQTAYDSAWRVAKNTDAAGNETKYEYDRNGNRTNITELEKSQLSGEVQVFITQSSFDGIDRLVQTVDSSKTTNRFAYDSRSNQTLFIDGNGNRTTTSYDGIRRQTGTIRYLTDTGVGSGVRVGEIATSWEWDDNSRLVAEVDDNGHATRYEYDALDRRTKVVYADGTFQTTDYDVLGNPTHAVDGNKTEVTLGYDLLRRLIRKEIIRGPGIAETTKFEEYHYDGLSRMGYGGDDRSIVRTTYDSLGSPTSEVIEPQGEWRPSPSDPKPISSLASFSHDGTGNLLHATYPKGGKVSYDYDELNRIREIDDASGMVVQYRYFGPGRVERKTFGNATWSELRHDGIQGIQNPPNDFGVRRIVEETHFRTTNGVTNIIEQQHFAWDRSANKTLRTTFQVASRTNSYAYDSAYRMVRSSAADGRGASTNQYRFDGVGNRSSVAIDMVTNVYQLSSLDPERDFQMNQYTATPYDGRVYDQNGNLDAINSRTGAQRKLLYDYQNRVVQIEGENGVIVKFIYDVLGRRLQKTVSLPPGPDKKPIFEITRYRYFGNQVCEEDDRNDGFIATYVWGRALDEVLRMTKGATNYFYHSDDQGNVMALTDGAGSVMERYDYEDYGRPLLLDARGLPLERSTVSNSLLFQGHRFDSETGLYDYRKRFLDPVAGRFIQRDPKGYVDGMNLFTFAGNNPWSRVDPFGTQSDDDLWPEDPEPNPTEPSPATTPVPGPIAGPTPTAVEAENTALETENAAFLGIREMQNNRIQEAQRADDFLNNPLNIGSLSRPDRSGALSLWQGAMPAHTAMFSRNPIGGSAQAQLRYANQVNALRSLTAEFVLGSITTAQILGGVAEIGLAAISRGVVAGQATLYRAVGPAELADIQANNVFRNLGSAEGKYFTTSAEAASSYAKQAVNGFRDPAYTIVQTQVPKRIFEGLTTAKVDRGGIPAWVIPDDRLPGLVPRVLDSMPIPHD